MSQPYSSIFQPRLNQKILNWQFKPSSIKKERPCLEPSLTNRSQFLLTMSICHNSRSKGLSLRSNSWGIFWTMEGFMIDRNYFGNKLSIRHWLVVGRPPVEAGTNSTRDSSAIQWSFACPNPLRSTWRRYSVRFWRDFLVLITLTRTSKRHQMA